MCGEHEKILLYGDAIPGSSPHVRGALDSGVNQVERTGIIPACAGSTMLLRDMLLDDRDHPRMCGEHTLMGVLAAWWLGSSPHVRGAQNLHLGHEEGTGIIPACAGSTRL